MADNRFNRRSFLELMAGLAVTGPAGKASALSGKPKRRVEPRIYSAHHENMVIGSTPADIQYEWVRAGLDACICALSGQQTMDSAWQTVFPGIVPSSKVAIKINCLRAGCSPQFAVVKALIESLTALFGHGFPAGNITLFDNTLWGTEKVEAAYGATALDELGIVYHDPSPQYADTAFSVDTQTFHPAVYLDQADYGISFCPLKRHQIISYADGTTGVIKNMMGACSTGTANYTGASTFHDGPPFNNFRDLFQNYMADHLQLYLVDMLFGTNHAEGSWTHVIKRITAGTDPCAIDSYVADVLQGEMGLGDSNKGVPQSLADAGLGTTDYTLIEPEVDIVDPPPERIELERLIHEHRQSGASEQEVLQAIKRYREQ